MASKRNIRLYRGEKCLNCHTPLHLHDRFCSYCGQKNSTKKLSFHDFFNEFFAGIFAYDSKIYRTIHALLFKPGKISADYIKGKRQQYANPYRFYLSASIIFFILASLPNFSDNESDFITVGGKEEAELAQHKLDSALAQEKLPQKTVPLDFLGSEKSLKEVYVSETELEGLGFLEVAKKKFEIFTKHYKETEIADSNEALSLLNYEKSRFNKWLYKKVVDLDFFASNPEYFVSYFIGKLPFIIFFCLPVFALFIWIIYIRKPYSYMEHLIFTFHNQSVLFLLLILAIVINNSFNISWFSSFVILLFLCYLYKAMRRFYNQGRFKTLIKFTLLNSIFLILAFFIGLFALFASFAVY